MKTIIMAVLILLTGCNSLKTTDQRAFTWNGDAAVAYMKANALARQSAEREVDRMLREFPANAFDLQVGIPQSQVTENGQVNMVIPVKMNFKREWLIKFFQNLYALNEDDGGMAQITVHSLYDMYDTQDVYNKADVVRGTVRFRGRETFTKIQSVMTSSRPTIKVSLLDRQNRTIHTQLVNAPSLSHNGAYPGVPVFVDIGNRSNYSMINLKWPMTPYQMDIYGNQPVWTSADILVNPQILGQVSQIRVDIVK
jgi:hypothetical protein